MSENQYLHNLLLPPATVTRPIDMIIARLTAAVDLASQPIFKSVEYGLYIPAEDVQAFDCPAVRLWNIQEYYNIEATQFVAGDIDFTLQLYVYLWSLPTDDAGEFVRIQKIREQITLAIFHALEPPEADNPDGMEPDLFWKVPENVRVLVDYATPFRYYGQVLPQEPPWYVTRIDIPINVCASIPDGG